MKPDYVAIRSAFLVRFFRVLGLFFVLTALDPPQIHSQCPSISSPWSTCRNENRTWSFTLVSAPAGTITWSVTGGASIIAGQGTSGVTVNFPAGLVPPGGNFNLTASWQTFTPGCGLSTTSPIASTFFTAQPLIGPTTACANMGGYRYKALSNWGPGPVTAINNEFFITGGTVTNQTLETINQSEYYEGVIVQWGSGPTGKVKWCTSNYQPGFDQCTYCDSVIVNLYSTPISPPLNLGPDQTVCSLPFTLDAGAGYSSYVWNWMAANTQTISPTATGTFWAAVANATGCSIDTVVVTSGVTPAPPVISASGPTTFCSGGSVQLSVPAVYNTYQWSTGATTPSITVSSSNTYSCTVTDASGCAGNTTPVVVTVTTAPSVAISGGSNLSICSGSSTNLLAGYSGATNFLWSNGSVTNTTTVTQSGTYYIAAWNDVCPTVAYDTVTVIMGAAPPTPVLNPSGPVCLTSGQTVTLTGPGGYTAYQWLGSAATTPTLTTGTAGNYALRVRNAMGCWSPYSATVPVAVQATASISQGSLHCATSFPTALTALPTGAGITYQWNSGATSQTISVPFNGSYTVTVHQANCASTTASSQVASAASTPVVTASPSGAVCPGTPVTLTATGGMNYEWSTGATTSSIVVTAPATVQVRSQSFSICWSNWVPYTVNTVTPAISGGTAQTVCATSRVLTATPSGSTYLWSTGATTQSITATSSGTYTCTLTHPTCGATTLTQVLTLLPPPGIVTLTPSGTVNYCTGTPVTVTAPAGYASYAWSTGATTQSITVTPTSTVNVTVTNAAGCTGISASTFINSIAAPITPTVSVNGPLTFCAGGSVTFTSSPGTSYQWSNGATTQSIVVTSSGTYQVRVANASGCWSAWSNAQTVNVLAAPSASILQGSSITVCGSSQLLTASQGSAYAWSTGATTQSVAVNASGTYEVTVTAIGGCGSASATTSVTLLSNPAAPVISPAGPVTLCVGGTLTANPSGFAAYEWNSNETTQSVSVLSSGTYSVRVRDANGCWSPMSAGVAVTVTAGAQTLTISPAVAILCTGSVTLDAGSGYTSYIWSTGATTQTIVATAVGTYSVTATGPTGCWFIGSRTVTAATPPNVSITPAAPAICAGQSVTFDAGAGFTSYLWSTGATSQSVTASSAGTYSVTVTNASGCTGNDSEVLTVNANPTPSITPAAPAICPGQSVTLNAGAGFTSYLWSTGATSQSIAASTAGTYSVTVTNANGCMGTDSEVLTVNANPSPSITPVAPVSCGGQPVTLNAGAGFSSYLWSTGATTQSIAVSTAGTYSVTVTNAGGCSGTDSEILTTASNPSVIITPVLPSICPGQSVTLNAGAGFSSYAWNTGATSQTVTVSSTGTYSVTVTNASGCQASDNVTVNATPPPFVSINATNGGVLCGGAGGNVVTLTSSIGAAAYLWSTGATTSSITVSTAGTYSLTVTTAAGCSNSASSTVTNFSSCQPPATLSTVNTTPTTATLSWSAAPCANKYRIYYKPATSTLWTQLILNAPATSTLLNSLAPNTTYQWRMRTNCTGGGMSNYSGTYTFTTPPLRTAEPGNAGEEVQQATIQLFPNPNEGSFTVSAVREVAESADLCIYEATGRLIHCERVEVVAGENEWKVTLPQVSAGVYLLRLGAETLRFVVDH